MCSQSNLPSFCSKSATPIIGSAFFTVGVITVFNAVFNYLGIAYLPWAASVFAGNTLFRASFGAAFPLFVSKGNLMPLSFLPMYSRLTRSGTSTLSNIRYWPRKFSPWRHRHLVHSNLFRPLQSESYSRGYILSSMLTDSVWGQNSPQKQERSARYLNALQ